MERLIDFFDAINPISPEDKVLMHSHLYYKSLSKGNTFFEEGKTCSEIGFVVKGVLRVVMLSEEGQEFTRYFINEGHFAVDLESFHNRTPSKERLEALTDCELVVMSKDSFNFLQDTIPLLAKTISHLTERALLEKYNIKSEMLTDDAPTRYKKLLERNPGIVQRIPLGIISSFLGISQYTLSRIRKERI